MTAAGESPTRGPTTRGTFPGIRELSAGSGDAIFAGLADDEIASGPGECLSALCRAIGLGRGLGCTRTYAHTAYDRDRDRFQPYKEPRAE